MRILNIIFLLCMVSIRLFSQENIIRIENDSIQMSAGMQVAYVVYIPEVTLGKTEHDWIKKFSRTTATPIKNESNEIQIKNAKIRDISDKRINIYSSLVKPNENVVKIIAVYEIDSVFFSPFKTQSIEDEKINYGIKNMMLNFAKKEYLALLKDNLFKAKSKYRIAKNKQDKLERSHESLLKQKLSLTLRVKNNLTELEGLENDEKRIVKQIEDKKDALVDIRDDKELYEIGRKQLKMLKKEKRKIEKNIERYSKENITNNIKIEKLEKDILTIKSQMLQQDLEVNQRSTIVQDLEKKIEAIED